MEVINQKKDNVSMPFLFKIFILVGICWVFFGSVATIKKYIKTKDYATITATYIGYKTYEDSDGSNSYDIIFAYTVDNIQYQHLSHFGGGLPPEVGETRNIKYNINNPSDALLDGANGYQDNIFVICLGLFFILLPLVVWIENKIFKKIVGSIFVIAFITLFGYFFYISIKNSNYFPVIFFSLIFISIIFESIKDSKYSRNSKIFTNENFNRINNIIIKGNLIIQIIKAILAIGIGLFFCLSPLFDIFDTSLFTIIISETFGLAFLSGGIRMVINLYHIIKK